MNSAQRSGEVNSLALAPEAGRGTLIYWSSLSEKKQAFVAAYIENSYSVVDAAGELCISKGQASEYLRDPAVKQAIAEVQAQLHDINFLNEKYVRAQLLKLYPKFIGEEDVPFITNTGEQGEGRKFFPEAALKVLEYIAPKKVTPSITINMGNLRKISDDELEKIAFSGTVIDG